MKQFFSSPKRVIIFIAFVLFCVLMAIGGVMMALYIKTFV